MRRLAAITVVLTAAVVVALTVGSRAEGSASDRFDVIFDDARGLVAGQLVKIAGANAGTIDSVVVTPDFKARIEATIDNRFLPFHRDATCAIRPQGLIAENYVDCDPGTANSAPLHAAGGHPPTVPVSHTSEPVSLLDLFNTFNLPTRDRLMVIIDELGIATAARGEDLNQILLRANPTLSRARQTIGILARQRAELQTIVDATDRIALEGANHTGDLKRFLEEASVLTSLTAAHSDSLSRAIARLPGLLAATKPSLQQLDVVAREGTPLLGQIDVAVPSLNRLAGDLKPFVKAANPGLARLDTALGKAIPAIRHSTPLVRALRSYSDRSRSSTKLMRRLLENLQRHGFFENFVSIAYYIAASLSRFDASSHLLSLLLVGAQNGSCGNYATTPAPGCSAHYGSQPSYKPSAGDLQALATYLVK